MAAIANSPCQSDLPSQLGELGISDNPSQSNLSETWTIVDSTQRAKLPLPTVPDVSELNREHSAIFLGVKNNSELDDFDIKSRLNAIKKSLTQYHYYERVMSTRIYKRLRREQCLTMDGVRFIHDKVINYANWHGFFDCWDAKERRQWLKEQFDKYYEGRLEDVWIEDESVKKEVLKYYETDDEYEPNAKIVNERYERAVADDVDNVDIVEPSSVASSGNAQAV